VHLTIEPFYSKSFSILSCLNPISTSVGVSKARKLPVWTTIVRARLKVAYDDLRSSFAFKVSLRRYAKAQRGVDKADATKLAAEDAEKRKQVQARQLRDTAAGAAS